MRETVRTVLFRLVVLLIMILYRASLQNFEQGRIMIPAMEKSGDSRNRKLIARPLSAAPNARPSNAQPRRP